MEHTCVAELDKEEFMYSYNHNNTITARMLRKNMTPEEKHLWYDYLKTYPVRFQRQKPIMRFIADFYCAKAKLVVELDGSQHYEEENMAKDAERTEYLNCMDIEVIRFSNRDVNTNFEGLCEAIDNAVKERVAVLHTASS